MLEEHKTALMLLRSRRQADGGCSSRTMSQPIVNFNKTQCLYPKSPEVTSCGDSSPEVMSSRAICLPSYEHSGVEKSNLNLERVTTEVMSDTEMTPPLEAVPTPKVPLMISVATSTDDLHELGAEVELVAEDGQGGEERDWNIRENVLCREEAEGRSRSVSPYIAEKRSYDSVQANKAGNIIYPLDEEVRELLED